ncbi:uromodulin-like [Engraulis encrasicolus]|uniref:uromodulin-like n=1 Tax=Engraulis encrasicolus TaxID=184585 RepID=UPI002FD17D95
MCQSGYAIPQGHIPTGDNYGCSEPDPCEQYSTLSEPWRNADMARSRDDSALQEGWFRFSGVGGDVLDGVCMDARSPLEGDQLLGLRTNSYGSVRGTTNLALYVKNSTGCTRVRHVKVKMCKRDSVYYFVHWLKPTAVNQSYSTRHLFCRERSCGEHAKCGENGACVCQSGYAIPQGHIPTGDNYGCSEPDPCEQYSTLSEPWRNADMARSRDDSALQEGWFRFSGVGGDVLDGVCMDARSPPEGDQLLGLRTNSYGSVRGMTNLALYVKNSTGCTRVRHVKVKMCKRDSVYYFVHWLKPTAVNQSYSTRHLFCGERSCGEHAECGENGACMCQSGYAIPQGHIPTGDNYGCSEPDPCEQYSTLSEPWRNADMARSRDDSALQEGWFRFSGVGGDVLDGVCMYARSPPEGHQLLGLRTNREGK